MKIAVCLIVFNGEPFIRTYLSHYLNCKDIDYVCVSEGATEKMIEALQLNGYNSNDNTVSIIKEFSTNKKLKYQIAEKPYTEKLEQQKVCFGLVPNDTDYIWVADSDEFYHYSDIKIMKDLLKKENYTWVDMPQLHFWKNFETIGSGGFGWGFRAQDRIFKWGEGYHLSSHRPITVLGENGINVKLVNPLYSEICPISCYHYSYIVRKMVYEKMKYYTLVFKFDYIKEWYEQVWEKWTNDNKDFIENKYSIHPSVAGAVTKKVKVNHPIDITTIQL